MSASAEAVARLDLNNSPYKQGLAEASQAMDKFSASIGSQLKHLSGAFVGAFAFEKIIGGFERAAQEGAKIGELASRFGVSASSLQKIGNAASLSGASIEDVATAMNKLAKNAGSAIGGNLKLQQTFEQIGVSVDDLIKMTPEQLFMKLSEAVSSGSLGSRDFAVAMELAGKNAGVLMEVLRGGPEEIDRVGKSMGVFSDDTVEQLRVAEDAMKKFNNYSTIFFGNILAGFMSLAQAIKEHPLHFFDWDLLDKDIEKMQAVEKEQRKLNASRTLGGEAQAGTDSETSFKSSRAVDAESRGIESAYKIGAKFDNDRLDYNRKEADRIAKLNETRAAQKEADQRAYFEKQSKDQKDYSARQDRQTMLVAQTAYAYMDAFTSKNNLEADIAGRGLASSRRGSQYLDQARRDQANNNRIDNYKFNEEQVQKYVDRMQQRGNGQSDKDFERYKNMTPDQAREAARRDLAKQQAQKENPSDREKAASDLAGYLQKVDTLLTQLTQYAHVT